MADTYQPPSALLTVEDSKRVADAAIAAIESLRIDTSCRIDAMCRHMETEQFNAELRRVP